MDICEKISERATCDRAHVGCILVRGNRIISTGYNGAAKSLDHCDDVGHDMEDGHCVRTAHAEENAIYQCAKYGIPTDGAEAYCTVQPCIKCTRALYSVGVTRIIFWHEYKSMSDADQIRIAAYAERGLEIFRAERGTEVLHSVSKELRKKLVTLNLGNNNNG